MIGTAKKEDFSEDRLMMREIQEVGPGQSFIGRKSTFENFRNEFWEPEIFLHSNLGQWREMGSKTIWQHASDIAKKKIQEHSYQIERDVKKELDKVYTRAEGDKQLEDSFRLF